MMTRGRLAVAVSLLLGFGSAWLSAQTADPPPIEHLVTDLQTKYESVRDFSADFEHRYAGGVLRTAIVEMGTVVIKKPGKMRWEYTSGEEKLYVSDGETFYSYFPVDRQVIVAAAPSDDRASTPLSFLSGRGRLADDFVAAYANEPAMDGSWIIRLTPRVPEADYESLGVTVDRTSLSITGLTTEDFQGGRSMYRFTNLRENQGVSDDVFEFEIPDGVDVITENVF